MDKNYNIYKMKNEMKLLAIPFKNSEIIYLELSVLVGSDNETRDNKTLEASHFLEHLFADLTSNKYPNGKKNIETFYKLGINVDASTENNITKFIIKFNKQDFKLIIDMFYNTYIQFKIDKKVFEQERLAIIDEIKQIIDDTWFNLDDKIDSILFKGHPRSISERDNLKSVESMNLSTVLNFYQKYYIPKNTMLTIAGDYNETMIQYIKDKFGSINRKSSLPMILPNKEQKKYNITYCKNTNTMLCNIYLIFRIPYIYFEDISTDFKFLEIILADGMNSILYKKLRLELGLIYSISVDFNLDETDKSLSYLSINTQIEQKNIITYLDNLLIILKRIVHNPINNQELDYVKKNINVSMLEEKLQNDPEDFISKYGKYVLWNQPIINFKQNYYLLNKVTNKTLKQACQKAFVKDKMTIGYSCQNNYNQKIKRLIDKFEF